MAKVSLKGVTKRFGAAEVIRGIDLEIEKGEFVVFVGPSGCGKSTLLRLIAGLEEITAGALEFDGARMNELPPAERGVAMVFQSYALYPHMNVFANMAFGLRLAKAGKAAVEAKVKEAARMLGLENLLDRLPRQLSGGQRQRVAIGRAIVRDPRVFLFDEPLSNLDAALRARTRVEIAALHERMEGVTMIYVTHDQIEAMTLADRIVVLRDGRVEQIGAPMTLYERPESRFVAEFIGSPAMNILPARAEEGGVRPDGGGLAPIRPPPGGEPAELGVRPEDLRRAEADEAALFEGRVAMVERLGDAELVHLSLESGGSVVAKSPRGASPARGEPLRLASAPERLHLFDASGRALR